MNYFLQANFKLFFIGVQLFVSLTCVSQSVNFKMLYMGKNLYVLNPYAPSNLSSPKDTVFCTDEVYLNGVKVMEAIRSSAYEINLSGFKLNDTVFAVIK